MQLNRRRFITTAAAAGAIAVAGCAGEPAGREAGAEVHVEDDKTDLEVDGENARWTWRGDVNPPGMEDPCDVNLRVAVFDAEGTEIDGKTTVLRDVDSGHEMRSVSLVLDPEDADRIATYEVEAESKQC